MERKNAYDVVTFDVLENRIREMQLMLANVERQQRENSVRADTLEKDRRALCLGIADFDNALRALKCEHLRELLVADGTIS